MTDSLRGQEFRRWSLNKLMGGPRDKAQAFVVPPLEDFTIKWALSDIAEVHDISQSASLVNLTFYTGQILVFKLNPRNDSMQ